MLSAAPESFAGVIESVKPLLALHYERLALNKDKVPLAPQYFKYLQMEARGELLTVVLRKDGEIIGYWNGSVAPGMHYETCLTAIMDIWFILPEHMAGPAPLVLFRAVEREMRRRGVQRAFQGEKLHLPCGKLYAALGYSPVEQYWSKWLGE